MNARRHHRLICAMTLIVIVAVVAVFILPTIDLEPTALRSMRSAQAILGSLALSWALVPSIPTPVVLYAIAATATDCPPTPVLDLNCTLLC